MKRIFHVADTHIGYSAYRKMDEASGLNQREVDTYAAFRQFIDCAVNEKPDAVLHAGDLFDSVRPTNRAISFALTQILRLSEAGIPFVVISGNHETPRLKETGSVFSLFEHIPGVYVVYKNMYELVELDGITIHAVPHCEDIEREKDRIEIGNEGEGENEGEVFNLAMLHAGISAGGKTEPAFMMGEINEQIVSIDNLLDKGLDYIALGHYHRCTKVADNAYYSGSTERFSFNEVADTKGFLDVQLHKDRTVVKFRPLHIREMVDLEPVVCDGLNAQELTQVIKTRINNCHPDGKIVRLKVLGIPFHVYHALDFDEFKRLTRNAVHFELRYEFKREDGGPYTSATQSSVRFQALHTEFEKFIDGYIEVAAGGGSDPDQGIDRKRLKELGLRYMRDWTRGDEED